MHALSLINLTKVSAQISQSNLLKPIGIGAGGGANMEDTMKKLKTNEFDGLLDEIAAEMSIMNTQDFKQESHDQEEADYNLPSIVSDDNILSDINQRFSYIQELGVGASCSVFKARHLENKKLYAIKELTKIAPENCRLFHKEVELLKKLIHPNILQYYDCYEDDNNYYIATEFCSGGTMLEKILKMKSFSEKKASKYIQIILSAVNYMHSLNIVHRDLKAQNMVFDKAGTDGVLQLIDFGDSKIIKDDEIYDEFIGTIHYIPPEVTRPRTGKELKKGDLWSIGIIAYLLVCGRVPFTGKDNHEIFEDITYYVNHKLPYPYKSNLTDSCKDFLERLLCGNIEKRMSASEALQHPWICGNMASDQQLKEGEYLRCLKKYNYGNKLQNILVDAILSEVNETQGKILNQGILEMNRKTPQMDGNCVVDYLLLNSPITDRGSQVWPKGPIGFNVHSPSIKTDYSHSRSHSHSFKSDDSHHTNIDYDDLDDLDVDKILDQVDKQKDDDDDEMDSMDSMDQMDKMEDLLPRQDKQVFLKIDLVTSGDFEHALSPDDNDENGNDDKDDKDDKEEEDVVDDDVDDEVNDVPSFAMVTSAVPLLSPSGSWNMPTLHAPPQYSTQPQDYFGPSQSVPDLLSPSADEMSNGRISVTAFREIMSKASKMYDIDEIVNDLDDGNGNITFRRIATYHKSISTVDDVSHLI